MGFKNLKYGDGRWFFVRAIMDEHLHKLLDRSYHIKEFKKTEFVGEASAGFLSSLALIIGSSQPFVSLV